MRAIAGLWRWRRNPLRRATDLVEAWVALSPPCFWSPAAPWPGWIAAPLTEDALQQSVRDQRERGTRSRPRWCARRPRAQARRRRPGDPPGARTRQPVVADVDGPGRHRAHGTVATGPPGPAAAATRSRYGRTRTADPVARPMDTATATTHAVLAGHRRGLRSPRGLVEGGQTADRLAAWSAAGTPDWTGHGRGRAPTGAVPARAADGLPYSSTPALARATVVGRGTGPTRARGRPEGRAASDGEAAHESRGGGTAAPWHRARSR